ncbi:EamA family transporter [Sphingomonas sp. MMS24-J13]|uniref:EamA family transporter n=1 Tax=Sphingomonas sp. MMS24-J13 TaxID=3238686 RepID=UPI00384CE4FA
MAIWGTHFLPAGVAAVLGSSSPLFLALFAWAVFHEPLTLRQLGGVATGFVGLALMGWTSAASGDLKLVGAASHNRRVGGLGSRIVARSTAAATP